jgi:fatty acid desaturase
MHDGVHQLLSKNKALNDVVGRILSTLMFVPLIVDFGSYRKSHFAHHRDANTVDDPDHSLAERFYAAPKWKAALIFLMPLSGLLFFFAVLRYPWKNWRSNPLGTGLVIGFFGMLIWGLAVENAVAQLIF